MKNTAAQKIAQAFRKHKCRVIKKCCTVIQGMVRGFLARRKVQKLKGQKCKVVNCLMEFLITIIINHMCTLFVHLHLFLLASS
jgi:hypothetical protein